MLALASQSVTTSEGLHPLFNQACTIPVSSMPRRAARDFSRQAGFIEISKFTVAALLIPEVPALLWYLRTHSTLGFRGWINTEYLLLLCLGLLYPSRRMIALLTAELTVALLEPITHIYYFTPRDALFSLQYLLLLPFHRMVAYACVLVCYVAGCAALLHVTLGLRRLPGAARMAGLTLVLAFLPAVVDLATGHLAKYGVHVGALSHNVDVRSLHATRMPVVTLTWGLFGRFGHPAYRASEPLASALGNALAELPAHDRPDIVLVLTESWGRANDDRINQAQMQPYLGPAIARLYRFQSGTVGFDGPTTSGETRELCGDSIGNSSISNSQSFFAACWPARLGNAGYRTLATHGFTPTMFNRKAWYRRFGFQQSAFLPELQRDGAAMCDGAFPGACDADVAHWIGNQLLAPRDASPMFVHWVTLNSHLPITQLAEGSSLEECAAVGIDKEQGLCSWFMHVLIVQHSVAELALKPGLRPTIFVIVGDHAPPFLRTDLRSRFSQTSVPYVVLMPRSIEPGEMAALRPTTPGRP